ncbi:hypothetical protein D3C71_2117740 [compost metagenome]
MVAPTNPIMDKASKGAVAPALKGVATIRPMVVIAVPTTAAILPIQPKILLHLLLDSALAPFLMDSSSFSMAFLWVD